MSDILSGCEKIDSGVILSGAKDLVRGCRRLTREPTAAWDEILRSLALLRMTCVVDFFTASERSEESGRQGARKRGHDPDPSLDAWDDSRSESYQTALRYV